MSANQFIEIDDTNVTSVAKDFFVDGLVLSANIYLKIKPNRYIMIGKKGTVSAISSYHAVEKDGAQIYVATSDLANITSANMAFTEKIVSAPKVASTIKVRYVNTLTDSVMADIDKFGFGTSIENIKKIGGFIQEVTSNIDGIDALLASLANLPNGMAQHSMSTAIIAHLICQEMGMTLKAALEKVVLGALLHDVGLREIPTNLLSKPRREWTPEEILHYESHPLRGVEMLREIPQISSDVLTIVNEHHENALGTGFPRRIRDVKMSPLARIVSLANYVTDIMYGETGVTSPARGLDDVIEHIENVLGQPFNKAAFLGLKNLANKQNLAGKNKK